VAIGAAVVVLREPQSADSGPRPVPPPQTTVAEYTSEGVVVPAPPGIPPQPGRVDVVAGPGRLALTWPPVAEAAGYEVRWGENRTRLVAQPAVQLDGLADGQPTGVEVRSVGTRGERSPAAAAVGTPGPSAEGGWSFAEEFDGPLDPARWRFSSTGSCGAAGPGMADDARRLVVTAQCGSEPVALAARTPLRLAGGPELGRVVVDTDQPGLTGELLIDLVPGVAAQIGANPGPVKAGNPGLAIEDPALPPGAIRVRVAARPGAPTAARVLVAPGTPRRGTGATVSPVPSAAIGVTVRWEVVLRTDGVRVLRDGVVVAAGDVVPAWREATAVIGLAGSRSGVRAAVDFAGFRGAPTEAPPLAPAPPLDPGQVVTTQGGAARTPSGGARVTGVERAVLLLTLLPQNGEPEPADAFSVEIGGKRFPAKPAVAGQPMRRGVRYPVVAEVAPDALVLRADGKTLPLLVHGPAHQGRAQTRVAAAHLELTPREGAPQPPVYQELPGPLERTRPALARPGAVLLDASGQALTEGGRAPRGRLVLELSADALGGQQLGGELAGLAGLEVRLDRTKLAGIPTVVDGPGVGGTWRIAIDTAGLPPGRHSVEVRAVGVDTRSAFAVAYAPFVLE
jgi:hypothetical protein